VRLKGHFQYGYICSCSRWRRNIPLPSLVPPRPDADRLLVALTNFPWKRHVVRMHGKEVQMPRLYQWMGLAPVIYGEKITPTTWSPEALEIRDRVRDVTGVLFNSVNINFYRSGSDHIGWHSDAESEGSWQYPIASVSLGAERRFQVCRYNGDGKLKRRLHRHFGEPESPVSLGHGSLVVMPTGSQEFYVHRLLKANKKDGDGARINLTFRMMSESAAATEPSFKQ